MLQCRGGGGIGSSSSPCDHVYSWQPRQITFAASVQEIACDYVAAQSRHLINIYLLYFVQRCFGKANAPHMCSSCAPLCSKGNLRFGLSSLKSHFLLGWKQWLEDASVLKRCPHSAAAHHFFFLNVSVSTSWAYRSSRHSSHPLICVCVCPRQTLTDGCWVCPTFFCFFFKWDEST